jgi:hypothetical protein
LTWHIVRGDGFRIDGDVLISDRGFDFEANQVQKVIVEAVNHIGASTQFEILVSITNVNEAPLPLSVSSVFDGQTLTITLSGLDPDGDPLTMPGPYIYTVADLVAGVPSFAVVSMDPHGLTSPPLIIDPPSLAAEVSTDAAPIIVSISASSVNENSETVVTVTAYDLQDGIMVQTYTIPAQNFEENQTYALPVSFTDSDGHITTHTFNVAVRNVDENRIGVLFINDVGEYYDNISNNIGDVYPFSGQITNAVIVAQTPYNGHLGSETDTIKIGYADAGFIPVITVNPGVYGLRSIVAHETFALITLADIVSGIGNSHVTITLSEPSI